MKIITYLYYFFRSGFLRGFYNTIKLLRAEFVYEREFGIKTTSIKRSESKEFFHYQGASYWVLFRIFSEIAKDRQNLHFVDIGSGMGRAVFVAEHFGFNTLTGIELDETLVEEARKNQELYRNKRQESQITFIHANALEYEFKNEPTLYFLFNPFNEQVLKRVLDRILSKSTSKTWFVYMNPLYPKAFERDEIVGVQSFKTRFYTEAQVFVTKH